ncbi:riboflavin transporter 2-like [Scyliorhinus canicula]|uniref:riboflavin transporter 2-like n=1 Tax=Scyliorhinus canicula TaxID=7830 RepID=UPI0018F4728C|nr:riboflavin transporter 2-like [Scyliorhinus canicula]XP_038654587.1 riboflavin transporter 2-like [Scyliorhinus canicula]XP_038654588.1 riboflavin transporter 2-like [Scyliorhinus canicula]XP_038654589.1 riboflavin transporter 2-like [Scyliorhinus canicula]XP_038654590.1 riboflavin transporter 2-like [Scyliorhinus canicula]XP_038654591.1 riboflavin transporter 2-like [Scyliorhinus canicula]
MQAITMALMVHVLAAVFGMGSWIAINGLWVELPLIVPEIPEGWYLPSYLTIIIQLANVGPLFVTLMHKFCPRKLDETAVIYAIVCLGIVACFLLPFFWKVTTMFGGALHSTALLVLAFFVSLVDCTSSVTFLPFMTRLQPKFLTSYFIGEGLSGLVPGLVALGQGVGVVRCVNMTINTTSSVPSNSTGGNSYSIVAHYQPANFPPKVFFFFLSGMMSLCLVAFILLNYLPESHHQRATGNYVKQTEAANGGTDLSKMEVAEQRPMISPSDGQQEARVKAIFRTVRYSPSEMVLIFLVLAWVNALTNAVLPSVQSYSCLPYGNLAYHLSAALGAMANPLACFVAMFYPNRSLKLMGFLVLSGSALASYIMAMAVLSPCPWLAQTNSGTTLIVLSWILFVGTLSYVKVMIGIILRDEGHSALVWCGAVVQLGSMLGALTMFPLVSIYGLFHSGDPCNTKCSL